MKDATRTYKLKEIHAVSNRIFDHGVPGSTRFSGTFAFCRKIAASLVHNLDQEGQYTMYDSHLTDDQTDTLGDIAYTLRVARNDDTCRGYRCSENSLTAGGYCGIHDGVDHTS